MPEAMEGTDSILRCCFLFEPHKNQSFIRKSQKGRNLTCVIWLGKINQIKLITQPQMPVLTVCFYLAYFKLDRMWHIWAQ